MNARGRLVRRGGNATIIGVPEFTYTGSYSILDDGDDNWRVKLLSSGTLTMARSVTVDVCVVGGGGSAATGGSGTPGSGGGGYVNTYASIVLEKNVSYTVVVGAGGAAVVTSGTTGNDGGKTWFSNESLYNADGGKKGTYNSSSAQTGGDGGSGGAGFSGAGGTDGGNGSPTSGYKGGTGQGTTTREFGEATGTLYASGGSTPSTADEPANTGNGGGMAYNGGTYQPGYAAASGICIVRNHRVA